MLCQKLDTWFVTLPEWGPEYHTVSINGLWIHSFKLLEVLCLINPWITWLVSSWLELLFYNIVPAQWKCPLNSQDFLFYCKDKHQKHSGKKWKRTESKQKLQRGRKVQKKNLFSHWASCPDIWCSHRSHLVWTTGWSQRWHFPQNHCREWCSWSQSNLILAKTSAGK